MTKFPTIHEMAQEIANTALKELQVNDLPLEEFIVRVDRVLFTVDEMYKKTESPIMKKFCKEILEMLNISLEEVEYGKFKSKN
jgi:hypothetical protein